MTNADRRQTQLIQDALAACGWKDAQLLEQQDTSEAFAFITETLQLPLLPLKVDLFHQGKGDKGECNLCEFITRAAETNGRGQMITKWYTNDS